MPQAIPHINGTRKQGAASMEAVSLDTREGEEGEVGPSGDGLVAGTCAIFTLPCVSCVEKCLGYITRCEGSECILFLFWLLQSSNRWQVAGMFLSC